MNKHSLCWMLRAGMVFRKRKAAACPAAQRRAGNCEDGYILPEGRRQVREALIALNKVATSRDGCAEEL